MPLNPKIKSALMISAKQGLNALLVNTSAWLVVPKDFNFHNTAGVEHILFLALGTVASREIAVWLPKILAWTQS